jgi:hypothetical protein
MSRARSSALWLWIAAVGCAAPASTPRVPLPSGVKPVVAVLDFRLGGDLGPDATVAGAGVADTDEVGAAVARSLTADLAAVGTSTIDGDVVHGAAALSDRGTYDPQLGARVAKKVGANLVVLGALTRYRQRVGSAWAVETPASVAFQAALVRAGDGAVLTVERFDYTQQALSENLLDLGKFMEAGGRWLTREEILDGALRQTAERLAAAARGEAAGPRLPDVLRR